MSKEKKTFYINFRSRKPSLVNKFLWWKKNIRDRDKTTKAWFDRGLKKTN